MSGVPSSTLLALQGALAGRYAIERELGRGGMGVVFLARDLSLDRPVAIKLLPPALAGVASLRERFLREARTAARLSHPHIVPIHAVEEHGQFVLFVMGYVEGETLGQRIARQGPLPAEEAARILQEVAWALAYAHQHGVIHRDVKPDNILLERATGRALVSDFGIAQVTSTAATTGPGEIVGTARYMSPEQRAGEPLDGRSDLFSLGLTAFQALTGRAAHESVPPAGAALTSQKPIPPLAKLRPDLPGRLGAIVDRCLALEPDGRFPDGEALAEALGAARGHRLVIAPAVERFVELYKTLATEIATYAAVLILMGVQVLAAQRGSIAAAIFSLLLTWGFFAAIALGVLRFLELLRAARRLLAAGHGIGDVRLALGGGVPGRPGAARPFLAALGWVAAAALWVVAFRWQLNFTLGVVLDGLIMALFTIVPVIALRAVFTRMLRPGTTGWWSRFWWKVIDWKVFKVAGLGRGAAPTPASQPTEIALGAGARELFEAMPAAVQRQLGEVPAVLERLELQAGRLRAAPEPEAQQRLGSTLAALEQLRLDLLRLRAESGAEGELTGDLNAARRIAERIEALLQAQRELDTPTPAGEAG